MAETQDPKVHKELELVLESNAKLIKKINETRSILRGSSKAE